MLSKKVSVDRTRVEIERRYQEKERHEHTEIPDSRIGARGERRLYKPREHDRYSIVNTDDGWKTLAFLKYETGMPSNDDGENGEMRVLKDGSNYHVIAKTEAGWKKTATLT